MSRPLRIKYPDAWYHLMNRGRRREEIYIDKGDYIAFIELLCKGVWCFTQKRHRTYEQVIEIMKREYPTSPNLRAALKR